MLNKGNKHYIILSNDLKRERVNIVEGTVESFCSEEQYNPFSNHKPHYYYLTYGIKIYDQSKGELISIHELKIRV